MTAAGAAAEPATGAWGADTVLLLGVAVAVCAAYLAGARRLPPGFRAWRAWGWRRWAFCAGVAVTVLAVLPPVDPVVDDSFVLHMAQHLVLMFVAAPLLALGAPGLPLLLALPPRWRRRVAAARSSGAGRRARAVVGSPVLDLVAFTLVLVGWHLPAVYTAALEHDLLHEAEHACFLLAAWLLWLPLAAPDRALDGGRGTLYVFLGGFPMIAVGAALVMAPRPLYPAQTGTGPGALAAQQLAGVIMWVPPTFLSLLVVSALVLSWFRGMERTSPGDSPLPAPIPPDLPGLVAGREEVAR
jgi:cytochrome c oxidase assembly factor CtaG